MPIRLCDCAIERRDAHGVAGVELGLGEARRARTASSASACVAARWLGSSANDAAAAAPQRPRLPSLRAADSVEQPSPRRCNGDVLQQREQRRFGPRVIARRRAPPARARFPARAPVAANGLMKSSAQQRSAARPLPQGHNSGDEALVFVMRHHCRAGRKMHGGCGCRRPALVVERRNIFKNLFLFPINKLLRGSFLDDDFWRVQRHVTILVLRTIHSR